MSIRNPPRVRPLFWVGSSKKDLFKLPARVVDVFGYALYLARPAASMNRPSRSKVLVRRECWKSSKIVRGIHAAPFIRFDWPDACLFCTYSRRNPNAAFRLPLRIWL